MNDEEIKAVIKEVEEELGDEGRVLVRPSGTEALVRVMVEAPTDEEVEKYCTKISNVVRERVGQ